MQGELLQWQTGTSFIHVPDQGDTPALQDAFAEPVQFRFAPAAALPRVQVDKLRGMAVTSAKRLDKLPSVPTMTEWGMTDFVIEPWQVLVAPTQTREPVVQRLNQPMNRALVDPAGLS